MNCEKSLIDQIIDNLVNEFVSEPSQEQLESIFAFAIMCIRFKTSNILRDVTKENDKK